MTPCARELRITYQPTDPGPLLQVSGPGSAAALLVPRLESEPVEVCVALLVNTKRRVLGVHEVGRRTLDTCIVHPRDVFKVALLANAAAVILAHNHPSGDTQPSIEDVRRRARLRQAADLVGIELLDFIIVGQGGRYVSFQERGE